MFCGVQRAFELDLIRTQAGFNRHTVPQCSTATYNTGAGRGSIIDRKSEAENQTSLEKEESLRPVAARCLACGLLSSSGETLRPEGDCARLTFSVRDTGIGIEASQQTHVFDKFTQADGSTTRRFGGTGLGLSICRSLIELMGGSIHIESWLGFGSRFWFEVPLPTAAEVAPAPEEPLREASFQSALPVLVAEDNRVNQKVAAALLRSFGLQVDVANNGIEALEKCSNNDYAVILMDCRMPEMDGYEATRRIRRLNRPRVPIIALTAGAAHADRQLALDAGMDGFISKPVHRDELARALEPLLGRCTAAAKLIVAAPAW